MRAGALPRLAAVPLSATVILLRDRPGGGFELFMVRRAFDASFMPGAFVFPGGRVDRDDGEVGAICAPIDVERLDGRLGMGEDSIRSLLVAGVRECFEEAGVLLADGGALRGEGASGLWLEERRAVHAGERALVDLAREHGLRLAIDRLEPFAHWITPAQRSKRFDAYFLVARHPDGQSACHDRSETIDSLWTTPGEALERHGRRDFPLAPPTFRTLEELAGYADAAAVLDAAPGRALPAMEPRMRVIGGELTMLLPGDPLYPPEVDEGVGEGEPTRIVSRGGCWVSERG